MVVRPALRNGERMGVQINYGGGENPFSQLGIRSRDVVLSLNFLRKRNGRPFPLTVNLEP